MLELRNIVKVYQGGTVNETCLFNDFSLSIPERQFVCVVGSNGSGKTSLLNIICGSIPIDEGKILIGNEDITHMPEHKRHRRIGRVYQDPARGTCPSMTILENMSMADNKGKPFNLMPCVNRKKTEEYRAMLAQLGLGLEDKMGVPVGNLSGGQRQAMALLMSTMKKARIKHCRQSANVGRVLSPYSHVARYRIPPARLIRMPQSKKGGKLSSANFTLI